MARREEVDGLADLDRALAELPKGLAGGVLRRVLVKRAEPVRDRWKANAPRESGAYAESVIVGTRLTGRQAKQARREGKDFAEVYVGTADPAGMQQEFGNVNHPAQAHARPAWDAMQDATLAGIGEDLAAEIEKTRVRVARRAAARAAKR